MIEDFWRNSGSKNYRDSTAYVDFNLQLPEEFLMMTDRFSMAHSVEARVPFLDHDLVELVYQIPWNMRTKADDPKYLLREIVSDLLPDNLIKAPKKGFVLPLKHWTRGKLKPLIKELLNESFLKNQNIFTKDVWKTIVLPHLNSKKDYTHQVWTLFMFQKWYLTLFEGKNN